MYQFDLSSSVTDGSYVLVFGTEVDNSGTVVETGYVTRETGKVILDLRDYSGNALVYFEDSSAGMGYVEAQSYNIVLGDEELLDPPSTSRTYSSIYNASNTGVLADSSRSNRWFPSNANRYNPYPDLWYLFDLGSIQKVSGILQRIWDGDNVEAFKIQYSSDGINYVEIDQYTHNHTYTYNGNTISNDYFEGIRVYPYTSSDPEYGTVPYDVSHNFVSPITARYVKFFPYEKISQVEGQEGIEQSGIS